MAHQRGGVAPRARALTLVCGRRYEPARYCGALAVLVAFGAITFTALNERPIAC